MDTTPTRAPQTPGRPSLAPPSPATPSRPYSVHTLIFRSLKRSHDLFLHDQSLLPPDDPEADKINRIIRAADQYGPVLDLVNPTESRIKSRDGKRESTSKALVLGPTLPSPSQSLVTVSGHDSSKTPTAVGSKESAIVLSSGGVIIPRKPSIMPKPDWHPPWKLMRVISGHIGWVRCLAIEPGNEWFASGANDRLIKIWDLAKGTLKISLTGHISPVRGLAVSARQPYLFSCGEDKTVKCWDLEYNKVIRHYHGHLSGVYCISLHPILDILVTGGRDNVARVWDMRTKAQIHALSGHTNTIASVQCQGGEPQVITGSHDSTIRLWDLVAGKTRHTLTHHKKSVRALQFHPKLNMFVSGAPDNIKQWMCPEGKFIQNLSGHNCIVNCLAVNEDNVLVSGGDEGSMYFWDWKTGFNFQRTQAPPQPGSLDSERGIYDMIFDKSGSRLITGEADKTIKIYKIDEDATEETHPINWKPEILKRRRY